MSINEYCTKIKTMADLLDNMDKSVLDAKLVAYTVSGLSRKWDGVTMHIRLQKPPPSWIKTRSILLGEESRLNSPRNHESNHHDKASTSQVLYSGQPTGNRRNNRRNDRRPENPPIRYGWVYIPPPQNQVFACASTGNQSTRQFMPISSGSGPRTNYNYSNRGLLAPPPSDF